MGEFLPGAIPPLCIESSAETRSRARSQRLGRRPSTGVLLSLVISMIATLTFTIALSGPAAAQVAAADALGYANIPGDDEFSGVAVDDAGRWFVVDDNVAIFEVVGANKTSSQEITRCSGNGCNLSLPTDLEDIEWIRDDYFVVLSEGAGGRANALAVVEISGSTYRVISNSLAQNIDSEGDGFEGLALLSTSDTTWEFLAVHEELTSMHRMVLTNPLASNASLSITQSTALTGSLQDDVSAIVESPHNDNEWWVLSDESRNVVAYDSNGNSLGEVAELSSLSAWCQPEGLETYTDANGQTVVVMIGEDRPRSDTLVRGECNSSNNAMSERARFILPSAASAEMLPVDGDCDSGSDDLTATVRNTSGKTTSFIVSVTGPNDNGWERTVGPVAPGETAIADFDGSGFFMDGTQTVAVRSAAGGPALASEALVINCNWSGVSGAFRLAGPGALPLVGGSVTVDTVQCFGPRFVEAEVFNASRSTMTYDVDLTWPAGSHIQNKQVTLQPLEAQVVKFTHSPSARIGQGAKTISISDAASGTVLSSDRAWFDCGVAGSPAPTEIANGWYTCSGGNGVIRGDLVNDTTSSVAMALVVRDAAGNQLSRGTSVPAGKTKRLAFSGRADGVYEINIYQDSQLVHQTHEKVVCDGPAVHTGADSLIVVVCEANGKGRVQMDVRSNDPSTVDYLHVGMIGKETAAPAGDWSRMTISGRPNGDHALVTTIAGTPASVNIDCP